MRPLARFLLIGTLLFASEQGLRAAQAPRPEPAPAAQGSVLDDEELLFRAALARGLAAEDPIARQRLVRNLRFADPADSRSDAALLAEALALGLERSDPVVRRRLVQRLRLEAEAAARQPEPDEAALEAHRARHAGRWIRPERLRTVRRDAQGEQPLPPLTAADLERRFGPAFARAVQGLAPGAVARLPGPGGGLELRLLERLPAEPLPLDAVRSSVRESLLATRGEARLRAELVRLRTRHALPVPQSVQ